MVNTNDSLNQRGKWNVLTRIEKFDNNLSLKDGIPDEVCEIPGNLLLNHGINALWATFAGKNSIVIEIDDGAGGTMEKTVAVDPFDHAHSYIGVGNYYDLEGNYEDRSVQEDDETLMGPLKVFMKMDTNTDDESEYPIAGKDQKIIFKSTFGPGVACFKWYEWGIANGNCNWPKASERTEYSSTRGNVTGFYVYESGTVPDNHGFEIVKGALGNNPVPDPVPVENEHYEFGDGDFGLSNNSSHILLNHKRENMGEKYPPSTWIITVEISLV